MSFVQMMTGFGETVPLPDVVTRAAIKLLVGRTQRQLSRAENDADRRFARDMAPFPIALNTAEANAQHYEIPAEFFDLVLGPQRKYSSCLYDEGVESLAAAEERALEVSAEHAALADGQRILELGCGWGSLSLWMASITLRRGSRRCPIRIRSANSSPARRRRKALAISPSSPPT
jgi:cyclopropane-fatty-acyl-phospholipid synthase